MALQCGGGAGEAEWAWWSVWREARSVGRGKDECVEEIKVQEDKVGCVGSHERHNKRSSCHTVITLTVPSCPLSVPSSSPHSEGNYIWMIQSSCRQ